MGVFLLLNGIGLIIFFNRFFGRLFRKAADSRFEAGSVEAAQMAKVLVFARVLFTVLGGVLALSGLVALLSPASG